MTRRKKGPAPRKAVVRRVGFNEIRIPQSQVVIPELPPPTLWSRVVGWCLENPFEASLAALGFLWAAFIVGFLVVMTAYG